MQADEGKTDSALVHSFKLIMCGEGPFAQTNAVEDKINANLSVHHIIESKGRSLIEIKNAKYQVGNNS